MTIEPKNYVQLAFPIPKSIHTKLKTVASAKGISLQKLILGMSEELFEKPENQKLLCNLK
jgi:hypothetical protein